MQTSALSFSLSKDFERVAFYVTKWTLSELVSTIEATQLVSTRVHHTIHGMLETQVALKVHHVCVSDLR